MAIKHKLIHFKKFSDFNLQKLSANEGNTAYTVGPSGSVVTGEPNILYSSICWIKDTKQMWTHATLYNCADVDLSDYPTESEIAAVYATKASLAKVATSGSYNDLSDKPSIPSAVTESTVSGWGFTKNTGTYSKPSTGIPKTDLASAVQISLGKADTALQSYTEQYKGTVTGVKMNGATKNPSSGVVDLGTVITAHQDISGKLDATVAANTYLSKTDAANTYLGKTAKAASATSADSATKATQDGSGNVISTTYATKKEVNAKQDELVSGTNVKTINNTSILGPGNIAIHPAYPVSSHGTSNTSYKLTPNVLHTWGTVTSLNLTLGTETSGIANEFLFQFTSGTTATTLTLPSTVKWADGEAPSIETNSTYMISIVNNLAVFAKF